MSLLIKGGRVIDPANQRDVVADVLVEDGRIVQFGTNLSRAGVTVWNAEGQWVVPGLIDVHVHLREPGQTIKETIQTGTKAAARGGFTSVMTMPNTDPVIDSPAIVELIRYKSQDQSVVRVYVAASVTKGGAGETLSDAYAIKLAGASALSDDPFTVMDSEVMRRGMEYAKTFDLPITTHCEDKRMVVDGVMHEGEVSTRLGLKGLPSVAEDIITSRNILLAEATGCRLHLAHLSTAGAVEMVRAAKRRGVAVTAEVTPHHLTLTHQAVEGYRASAKMNPPLRTERDLKAVLQGLQDGTIDCIATDHAPHTHAEKEEGTLGEAPFGIIGLETSVGVIMTALVHQGVLTPHRMVEAMSTAPAKIFGFPGGHLSMGASADITVIDPERVWTVESRSFASKGRNTPYEGAAMKGKAVMTMVGGKVVYEG